MGCNQSSSVPTLLDEVEFAPGFQLANRMVMAAMTRGRCDPHTNVPTQLNATYYSQRAGFGLILTECSAISARGNGFYGSGAIFNEAQEKGWKIVTDEVHKKGGKILLQIVHCGRVATSKMLGGDQPLGPSAIAVAGKAPGSEDTYPVPIEMTESDIKEAIKEFKEAALRAIRAGFDGVELHGANGYLIDQFLRSKSNHRKDEYGGSVENRARFGLEVLDTVIGAIGKDQVAIKISPCGEYNDMKDEKPLETYQYFLEEIDKRKILFVEISQEDPSKQLGQTGVLHSLRPFYKGTIVGNSGFNETTANQALAAGTVSLVSFAKLAITNPDLPHRYQFKKPVDESVDYSTMFFGGEKGYTDFKTSQ